MIATDEAALECDFAETYHIYDYRALTPDRVALFSIGLRDDSRIKLRLNDQKYSIETLLLAAAVDRLSLLFWSKTESAKKNRNRPISILAKMMKTEPHREFMTFESAESFEKAMQEINKRGGD